LRRFGACWARGEGLVVASLRRTVRPDEGGASERRAGRERAGRSRGGEVLSPGGGALSPAAVERRAPRALRSTN
jgi:hypothetical protein